VQLEDFAKKPGADLVDKHHADHRPIHKVHFHAWQVRSRFAHLLLADAVSHLVTDTAQLHAICGHVDCGPANESDDQRPEGIRGNRQRALHRIRDYPAPRGRVLGRARVRLPQQRVHHLERTALRHHYRLFLLRMQGQRRDQQVVAGGLERGRRAQLTPQQDKEGSHAQHMGPLDLALFRLPRGSALLNFWLLPLRRLLRGLACLLASRLSHRLHRPLCQLPVMVYSLDLDILADEDAQGREQAKEQGGEDAALGRQQLHHGLVAGGRLEQS